MRICVLQPDYSTSQVDYKNYDPVRELGHLMPEATVDHVLLNKLSTYKQLRALSKEKYDVFVNLCEGYLEWDIPSIDVIHALEALDLPYTGPTSLLYDPTKELMKYVAHLEGIRIPAFAIVEDLDSIARECAHLKYPLFVKPHKAGDSLGVDEASLVHTPEALYAKCAAIIDEYGPLLVEEYISGREFTVMCVADAQDPKNCIVFKPIEYIFPEGFAFKTYALKTSELHPESNIPVKSKTIERKLKEATRRIFQGFGGVGYARLDFRMNERGELYFLEINFTCSVFYADGYEGSADYILKCDGTGQAGFLKMIVEEGIARHQRKQKKYAVKGNSISGYGAYASADITAGEVIFKGEESAQRIVTKRYVKENWNEREQETFRRYAYPLSKEVFFLWDTDPANWVPQNHSCDANTHYVGLDVVATRHIAKGEELTLNYAVFLDDSMEPFVCQCGAANCNKLIMGFPGNSVTTREETGAIANSQ